MNHQNISDDALQNICNWPDFELLKIWLARNCPVNAAPSNMDPTNDIINAEMKKREFNCQYNWVCNKLGTLTNKSVVDKLVTEQHIRNSHDLSWVGPELEQLHIYISDELRALVRPGQNFTFSEVQKLLPKYQIGQNVSMINTKTIVPLMTLEQYETEQQKALLAAKHKTNDEQFPDNVYLNCKRCMKPLILKGECDEQAYYICQDRCEQALHNFIQKQINKLINGPFVVD